jgi:hypothetical protein
MNKHEAIRAFISAHAPTYHPSTLGAFAPTAYADHNGMIPTARATRADMCYPRNHRFKEGTWTAHRAAAVEATENAIQRLRAWQTEQD